MSNPLANFSEEQLKAELAGRKNKDWYFFENKLNETDEDAKIPFNIVHKRQYHIKHSILSSHIEHLILLPKGFCEAMESEFEYEGDNKDSTKLLAQYGFTELKNPFYWFDALTQHLPLLKGGPRISFTSDTPEIKKTLDAWIAKELTAPSNKMPKDWNSIAYLEKIKNFAKDNNLVDVINENGRAYEGVWGGADISLLSREVYASLPEYPENYLEC